MRPVRWVYNMPLGFDEEILIDTKPGIIGPNHCDAVAYVQAKALRRLACGTVGRTTHFIKGLNRGIYPFIPISPVKGRRNAGQKLRRVWERPGVRS